MATSPSKRVGGWTKEEIKAIGAYAQKNGLKLTMCSRPTARFIDAQGKEVTRDISDLASAWAQQKEEDRKHALYEKRRIKQEEERASWGVRRFQ